MELDALDELLEVLRTHGVTRYECGEFSLVIGVAPVPESEERPEAGQLIRARPAEETNARGIYANPSLWPGGQPPKFPRKQ